MAITSSLERLLFKQGIVGFTKILSGVRYSTEPLFAAGLWCPANLARLGASKDRLQLKKKLFRDNQINQKIQPRSLNLVRLVGVLWR
jgi:hypothetical protein